MKTGYQKPNPMRAAALVALLLALYQVTDSHAQWQTKWLSVGELHHPYLSGGAEPENLLPDVYLVYPGIQTGSANNHWKGLWISALDWTDENGESWDIRTSHIGPRGLGLGEFFDESHILVSRFEPPDVTVDGFETFHRPVTVEEVDEALNPDRMVRSMIHTSVGVSIEKRAMQFSNEHHDNYHIIEYIFTNTGNVDDDEEIELPDQTLNDVYFTFLERPKVNAPSGSWDNSSGGMAWGQHVMNDATGEGLSDYGVDFRSQFSWIGAIPDKLESYNTLGDPMWFNHQWNSVADDTLGRLGGATMVGNVVLHADAEAHEPGANDAVFTPGGPDHIAADDPAQPHTMTYIESDWSDITTGNDHTNVQKMQLERDLIECGARGNPIGVDPQCAERTFPTHAYFVHPATGGDPRQGEVDFVDHFTTQLADPSLGRAGGWGFMNAYGPYDMAPGQQVKIVMAEGVAGLSQEAQGYIGRQYRLSGANDNALIAFDPTSNRPCNAGGTGCVEMTKNEWALTARDSLFQMFERAKATYDAGYDIPTGPLPPSAFHVNSGTDRITLEWDVYPGGEPLEWELWRAQKSFNGIVTALRVSSETGLAVPDSARAYELIATLPGSARSYTDEDVVRGIDHFYYLQAVGEVNNDPTGNTPTGARLKSNRYYAQTYEPVRLRRPPGSELSEIRVVPNPYNLQATTDVRFGDKQDKIAFYGLPAQATIKIYTELGELVETIEHTNDSGDEFWFLTTYSRQLIVSGIYLAVIENRDEESPNFGEQVIRKIIIIR